MVNIDFICFDWDPWEIVEAVSKIMERKLFLFFRYLDFFYAKTTSKNNKIHVYVCYTSKVMLLNS